MSEKGGSRFFQVWARNVLRFRWLILPALVGITALAILITVKNVYVDNSVEAFAASESKTADLLEDLRDDFGRDEAFMVVIEGDVFSFEYLAKLKALQEELDTLDVTVESLGQRKVDRDLRRGRPVALKRLYKRWGMAYLLEGSAKKKSTEGAPDPKVSAAEAELESMDADLEDDEEDEDEDEDDAALVKAARDAPAKPGDDPDKMAAATAPPATSIMDEVTSIINVRRTVIEKDKDGKVTLDKDGKPTLKSGELMNPFPANEAELLALKESVLGDPEKGIPPDKTLVGQVISADGRYSVILLRTAFMSDPDSTLVNEKIQEVVDRYSKDGFKAYVSGMPAMAAALNHLMLSDLRLMFSLAMGVLFVFMLIIFRHPIGMLGPAGVVILSLIWAAGVMNTIGFSMTMLTNILPAFIICVGVGDAVHLVSVYRDARRRGFSNDDSIVEAVGDTGVPIFFTTMTTAFGLLSFTLAEVDAIGEMGMVGAIAVGFAFFHSVVFLPIALSFNKTSLMGVKKEKKEDFIDRLLHWCADFSGSGKGKAYAGTARADNRRIRTLVLGAVFSAIALYGAFTLRVWHNPMSWVPPDKPISIAVNVTDDHLGGTANVQLIIDSEGGTVKSQKLMKGLEKLEAYVRAYEDPKTGDHIVGNVTSLVDVVRESNRAWNLGKQEHYKVPDKPGVAEGHISMFENQDPEVTKRLITKDGFKTQMSIRLKWLEATSYAPFTEYIQEGIDKFIPRDVAKVEATGSVYNLLTTVGLLIWDLLKSFSLAFTVITILMMVLLKEVKLGLIAMVPNLMPIVFILGIMGFANIPIDMANLMIASIALGVAVDDTIHFLHHFKEHYDRHGNVDAAIAHSMTHSGRAMVATSIILTMGFFVYLFATMYSLQRFGLLIGLTVIMALFIDLIGAPALLRTFYKNKTVPGSGADDVTQGDSNAEQTAAA